MIEILRLSLPITVWLTGFSAVYALQGLSCSRHWPADLEARPVLLAAWAIAIVLQLIALIAVLYAPSPARFVQTGGHSTCCDRRYRGGVDHDAGTCRLDLPLIASFGKFGWCAIA